MFSSPPRKAPVVNCSSDGFVTLDRGRVPNWTHANSQEWDVCAMNDEWYGKSVMVAYEPVHC
jgi:hypothetical protein